MNAPALFVVTARGGGTFPPDLRQKIQGLPGAKFVQRERPFTASEFHRHFRSAHFLALTPRSVPTLTKNFLAPLRNLRGVAVYATGLDWVDTHYLNQRGIRLFGLAGYATDSVADHAVGMLLTMTRRLHLSWDRSRGMLPAGVSLRGWELRGKRVGVFGFGRIGRAIERRLFGFSCRITSRDRRGSDAGFKKWLAPLDVLILAAGRCYGSAPILGERELGWVKPGLLLINPARAALVDPTAVRDGISQERLGGYAVDNTVPELLDPALEHGRIFQTAHTAWYSTEAIQRGLDLWVANIIRMVRTGKSSCD